MRKALLFLISITLFWGMIKLSRKSTSLQFFSRREQEILNLLAVGYKDDEIAELLHSSQRTIEKNLWNIERKMNVHDVSSAVEYAIGKKLVSITYA